MNENIRKQDPWRLGFHLMPPDGWLNDPNGLCEYQGKYHVFFQYSPGEPDGGLKHWGHYVGEDLLHWEYAGIALSPEEAFEKNGSYSGSALVDENGMHLFYTGNVKLDGDYNYITNGREANTILVSSKDGRTFGEKQCLMKSSDYPKDLTCHVRDPKVLSAEEAGIHTSAYYMLLGARTLEDVGEVLLYESNDLKDWTLLNRIGSGKKFGYMWECPDLFCLGDTKILSVSPQGMEQEGSRYENLYQSGYFITEGDLRNEYRLQEFIEWDQGFDFYAPQTFQDEQGRRILIGWIGMPDVPEHQNPTVVYGWQNALTVPRVLTMKEGKVLQNPAEELEQLRREKQQILSGQSTIPTTMWEAVIENAENEDLTIRIADGIFLTYCSSKHCFALSFDQEKDLGKGRKQRSTKIDALTEVRILADTSCLEIYLNSGEQVFTTRFYTEDGRSNLCVQGKSAQVSYWELNEFSVNI